MLKQNPEKKWDIVVIGAGQAGLAIGYFLKKMNRDFMIIDMNEKTGDSWRNRWNSLLLFTPSQYDGLPGMPFPAKRGTYPDKNQMAEYLENYALKYSLPVKSKVKVIHLLSNNEKFELETTEGKILANNVIIATGTNPVPKIPSFAKAINPRIFQIHSSSYNNPEALPEGDVLVVGGGTSGVEIAIELSKTHKTYLSGKLKFHIPDAVFKYAGRFYWWFVSNLVTTNTPMGRKARSNFFRGGAPLIRVSDDDLAAAGVKILPRVSGVENGLPQLEDGSIPDVATIIWATGYKPDFSWIEADITDNNGWPKGKRGISNTCKGLFFIGMPFQFGLTSGLVGGVGRDAEYISKQITTYK
jgi:putative flavoprotein involved in K+ transport